MDLEPLGQRPGGQSAQSQSQQSPPGQAGSPSSQSSLAPGQAQAGLILIDVDDRSFIVGIAFQFQSRFEEATNCLTCSVIVTIGIRGMVTNTMRNGLIDGW